jgi:hypothetical protein
MHIASIGIDLGKATFHLVALGERNKILMRRKFSRSQLMERGLTFAVRPIYLRKNLPTVIEDAEQNLRT